MDDSERRRVDAVDPLPAGLSAGDDVGIEKHVQVLRDERVREARRLHQASDRLLAPAEKAEPPRRFSSAIAWNGSALAAADGTAGNIIQEIA